jgi:hypothetical protein
MFEWLIQLIEILHPAILPAISAFVCVPFKKGQATSSLIINIMDEIESEKQPNKLPLSGIPPDTQQGEVILSENGIVLHPQAVDDALDPLNWTSFQKHTILAIVMAL